MKINTLLKIYYREQVEKVRDISYQRIVQCSTDEPVFQWQDALILAGFIFHFLQTHPGLVSGNFFPVFRLMF